MTRMSSAGYRGKRLLDLLVASTAIVILSPVMMAIAVLVRLLLGKPVLFRQQRPGLRGVPFIFLKFRTMTEACDPAGNLRPDGERLTCLGGFLRSLSLDELPELFNVIRGDMSLVGPRPPLVSEYERFTSFQRQKLSVKPGMTGLWQVEGRNQVKDLDQWVRLDLEYIRCWSLGLDLKILFRTVTAVLSASGK